MTQKAIKGKDLVNHLVENPVDIEYETLWTCFQDEEILFMGEHIAKTYPRWRLFFDRAVNFKGSGIEAVLVSEIGQYYPTTTKLHFPWTNNMAEYEAYILSLKLALDMGVHELLVFGDSDLLIHQVRGEWEIKNSKITPYVELVMDLC